MNDGRRSIDRWWHRESVNDGQSLNSAHTHEWTNSERLLPMTSRHCFLHLQIIKTYIDAVYSDLLHGLRWGQPCCDTMRFFVFKFITVVVHLCRCVSLKLCFIHSMCWVYITSQAVIGKIRVKTFKVKYVSPPGGHASQTDWRLLVFT